MLRALTAALALGVTLAGPVYAETFEVQMLNKGTDGNLVFEPAFLKIAKGDTVSFVATNKGHNAETIKGMIPEGAEPFAGKISKGIDVTLTNEGLYAVKCKPHYALGMVMTIAVGDNVSVPASFFKGRIPKKAKQRLEQQVSGL